MGKTHRIFKVLTQFFCIDNQYLAEPSQFCFPNYQ